MDYGKLSDGGRGRMGTWDWEHGGMRGCGARAACGWIDSVASVIDYGKLREEEEWVRGRRDGAGPG